MSCYKNNDPKDTGNESVSENKDDKNKMKTPADTPRGFAMCRAPFHPLSLPLSISASQPR